jgi:hypothetical protein
MPYRVATAITVTLLLGLAGCASQSSGGAGVAKVGDFVTWVERVHVETELAMQRTQAATASMQAIVGGQSRGDPVTAFKEFTGSLGESEKQASTLTDAVRAMRSAAQKVFDQWNADLLLIESAQMRARSEQRMDAAWKRYQALLAAARAADNGATAFHKGMRDLSLFLGNDLNASSIADIREDANGIAKLADDLDGRYRRSLEAARDYLATAALANAEESQPQPAPRTAPANPEPEPARRPPSRPR